MCSKQLTVSREGRSRETAGLARGTQIILSDIANIRLYSYTSSVISVGFVYISFSQKYSGDLTSSQLCSVQLLIFKSDCSQSIVFDQAENRRRSIESNCQSIWFILEVFPHKVILGRLLALLSCYLISKHHGLFTNHARKRPICCSRNDRRCL